jgi:hypothetical protein
MGQGRRGDRPGFGDRTRVRPAPAGPPAAALSPRDGAAGLDPHRPACPPAPGYTLGLVVGHAPSTTKPPVTAARAAAARVLGGRAAGPATVREPFDPTAGELDARLPFSLDTIPLHAPAPLPEGRMLQRCRASHQHTTAHAMLAVGPPDDAYEREADRVAGHVGRAPGGEEGRFAAPVDVRHRDAPTGPGVTAAPGSVVDALRDGGRPLEPHVRRGMEQVFGFDFSHVRVHDGAAAKVSARDVRASAYTLGDDIVFAEGRYAPSSSVGRALLAHELTHVVQQSGGAARHVVRRAPQEEGPPTPVVALSANQVRLGELMAAWIPAEKQHLTTISRAAAIESATGRRVYLIAIAGEGAAVPLNTALLMADEVLVPYAGGHAELQTMHFAGKNGYQLLPGGLHPSRDFCTNCAWWSRKGGLAPPDAGVRVGQKSKRLADVSNKELTENLAQRRLPGARGEPTAKGLEKRQAAAAKRAAALTAVKPPPTGPAASGPQSPVPEPAAPAVTAASERAVKPVTAVGTPAVPRSPIRPVLTGIALNVLLFAVSYYLQKRHAEKQARKLNADLARVLPDINAQVQARAALIAEMATVSPLLYANVTVTYTRDKYEATDYNEGSMTVPAVVFSHQNYQVQERLIKPYTPLEGGDPLYLLTFSVPLFEETTAEKGASSGVSHYRGLRKRLADESSRVRLSAAINLYRLVLEDRSLEALAIRDLLGLLRDEDAKVRLAAANFLSKLGATIAIPYIRDALTITRDGKHKAMIQRYLRELERG